MLDLDSFRQTYLVGAVVVWTGIVVASTIILLGTPYFAQMAPVLVGGAFWFAVVIPAALQRAK